MTRLHLLDLPNELLDRVYNYLDWDRSQHLIPSRPDILSTSLTCRHLRQSILPLLFRNVSFCMRWYNGALLEPAILELRRERPDLARYVRCVHICTRQGRPTSAYRNPSPPMFAMPDGSADMELNASGNGGHHAELQADHKKRATQMAMLLHEEGTETYGLPARSHDASGVEEIIRHMVEQTSYTARAPTGLTGLDETTSEEDLMTITNHLRQYQSAPNQLGPSLPLESWLAAPGDSASISLQTKPTKYKIDALAAVLLCVPATVTELVCEAGLQGHKLSRSNLFPTNVVAVALELFANRLESLTLTHSPTAGPVRASDRISDPITPELTSQLTSVKHLRLTWSPDPVGLAPLGRFRVGDDDIDRWTALKPSSVLTVLEIWNIHLNDPTISRLQNVIKNLTNLKQIRFQNVLSTSDGRISRLPLLLPMHNPARQQTIQESAFLQLAINLRRALPTTHISFSGSLTCSNRFTDIPDPILSPSAVHWIETEAIPACAFIDPQREERLLEDFESFLFLWQSEDSPAGREAKVDGAMTRGQLVDAAFTSRWKNFTNVRRDKGEWAIM